MPAERVSMKKIRDVLRLTFELGMSRRKVREATGIGRTAVTDCVQRAGAAGLVWPLPVGLDDIGLERLLFPPADALQSLASTEPDWAVVHAEMKRRGVTMTLLWQEYRIEHGQGYAYSWFCERYRDWKTCVSPTMAPVRFSTSTSIMRDATKAIMRNALAHVGVKQRAMVAAAIRTAFVQETKADAHAEWRAVADRLRKRFPRLSKLMDEAEHDVLGYVALPKEHWSQIHSTDPIERLNREVKRRTNVVSIFPNDAAIVRLVGAVLLEQNDEWAISRRYMTPETLTALSEDQAVRPTAIPAIWPRASAARTMTALLHHALGHYLGQRPTVEDMTRQAICGHIGTLHK